VKRTLRILALLMIVVGLIWVLQGVNVLPGSFMTGQIRWAWRGAGLGSLGVLLLVFLRIRH
jgi:hypothetical protein